MSNEKNTPNCRFSSAIECTEKTPQCHKCGWNPKVAKKRKKGVGKRGEWVDHMVRDWRCSVCGEKINKVRHVDGYCYDDKPNFCPNCGADMRGANHETD